MNTFGFIGTGNMGGALARSAAKAVAATNITLADQCSEKAAALASELGCAAADAKTVAENCGFIFLVVKPQVMGVMLVIMFIGIVFDKVIFGIVETRIRRNRGR